MHELHSTHFCLPHAHCPLLLLPFAWLQKTKLLFSAHTFMAVVSLASHTQNWHGSQYGGRFMDPQPYTPTWNKAYIMKYLLSYVWLSVMTCMVQGDECKWWNILWSYSSVFCCMNEPITLLLLLNVWGLVRKGIHSSYILDSLFLTLVSAEDFVFWGMMLHHWVISEWYFEGTRV